MERASIVKSSHNSGNIITSCDKVQLAFKKKKGKRGSNLEIQEQHLHNLPH